MDAGEKRQVKRFKKKAALRNAKERDALKWVLSDERGRKVVWKFLSQCKLYRGGYIADSNLLHFDNGQRTIGVELLTDIFDADPTAYTRMRQEAEEADKKLNTVTEKEKEEDAAD